MDIKSANDLLNKRISPDYLESKQMVDGDLWLDGKGLIIKKSNDPKVLQDQEDNFNTQNALAEVVGRRVDGLLGREPIWTFSRKDGNQLTDEDNKRINEITLAIVEFWNKRQILSIMRGNYENAMSLTLDALRPYVPSAYKDEKGNIIQDNIKSFSDALDILYFDRVSSQSAGVFLEETSQKPYSIYRYEKDGQSYVDFSFVDADGITHFQTFAANNFEFFLAEYFPTSIAKYSSQKTGEKQTDENSIDLGGKLMLFELGLGKPFITETMKENQRGISLAKTMKGRNTYTGGFRERHFLGVEKPKQDIPDPNNPGKAIKVDAPLKVGPGSSTFSQPTEIYDQDNKIVGRAVASLVVVDPVPVDTFIEAKDEDYYSILAAASQTHVLASDSVSISGVSRKDSRSEHEKKLKIDKVPLDAEGRYIIEFCKDFAAVLTGREKEFEVYRCDFNCIVDAGLPTPEEKEDNRKAYAAGEISLETLMSRNGVEDTDAELAKIKSEDGYEFNLIAKAAVAFANAKGTVPMKLLIIALPIEEDKKKALIDSLEPVMPERTI